VEGSGRREVEEEIGEEKEKRASEGRSKYHGGSTARVVGYKLHSNTNRPRFSNPGPGKAATRGTEYVLSG
jgi:hypothetical protein